MKRIICMSLVLMLLLMTAACSSSKSAVDMNDLKEKMLAADNTLPDMTTIDSNTENAEELFAYLSEVSYDKVGEFFLSYSSEGLADEIAVVYMKSSADVEEMKESLQEHIDGRISLYESYEPEQVPRAEEALIFSSGNYAVLIVSDEQNQVKAAFQSAVQ